MIENEIMAMTDEDLCVTAERLLGYSVARSQSGDAMLAWIPFKPHTWRPIHDYTHDIAAAWKLFEKARSYGRLWDFCEALKAIAKSDDLTVIMGSLDADIITRAFVMAMTKEGEENNDQRQ